MCLLEDSSVHLKELKVACRWEVTAVYIEQRQIRHAILQKLSTISPSILDSVVHELVVAAWRKSRRLRVARMDMTVNE